MFRIKITKELDIKRKRSDINFTSKALFRTKKLKLAKIRTKVSQITRQFRGRPLGKCAAHKRRKRRYNGLVLRPWRAAFG